MRIPADLIHSSEKVRVASDVAKLEAQSKAVLAQLPGVPPLVALTVLRRVRGDVPLTPLAAVQRAAAEMELDVALPPRKFRVAVRLGRHTPRDVKYAIRFCPDAVQKAAVQDGGGGGEKEAAATAHGSMVVNDEALGYLLTLQLVDTTGEVDATLSEDDAVTFFGRPAAMHETGRLRAVLERLRGPCAVFECIVAVYRCGGAGAEGVRFRVCATAAVDSAARSK